MPMVAGVTGGVRTWGTAKNWGLRREADVAGLAVDLGFELAAGRLHLRQGQVKFAYQSAARQGVAG